METSLFLPVTSVSDVARGPLFQYKVQNHFRLVNNSESKNHSLKGKKLKHTLHQDVCFVTSQNAQLMKWC